MCIYGWMIDFPLLTYFPLTGIFLGATQIQYWLSSPETDHIGLLSILLACFRGYRHNYRFHRFWSSEIAAN